MDKTKPEEVILSYVRHINNSDLETIMSLYDSNAAMAVQPGQLIYGHEQIRQKYQSFLGKVKFDTHIKRVISTSDTALVIGNWTINGTGPDGKPLDLSGTATDILRKQSDGTWLVIVDNLWGTD
jgi:ketosteroid isomerase-like protein